MAKADIAGAAAPKCLSQAEKLGYELIDVSLDREPTGKYLRIYIDKPEGITLDDCEAYHRAIQPQLESLDYDFLEVSSPGIDRPLKKDRDFERALGETIEVHLFKPEDGSKLWTGVLTEYDSESFTIGTQTGERRYLRKAVALVKPVVDMSGVEDVDLSGE